jgi:hypothetical protein
MFTLPTIQFSLASMTLYAFSKIEDYLVVVFAKG